MTELERARAHLRFSQGALFSYRQWCGREGGSAAVLCGYEGNVLAALSWMWEAQEKHESERRARLEAYRAANFPHHAFAWTHA